MPDHLNRPRLLVYAALIFVAWSILLAGCDSVSTASGADQIVSACKSNTNAPDEACECIGAQAETQLSEPAAVWLATALSGNTEEALKLKESVPWDELLEASMFMMNAGQNCALEEGSFPALN